MFVGLLLGVHGIIVCSISFVIVLGIKFLPICIISYVYLWEYYCSSLNCKDWLWHIIFLPLFLIANALTIPVVILGYFAYLCFTIYFGSVTAVTGYKEGVCAGLKEAYSYIGKMNKVSNDYIFKKYF